MTSLEQLVRESKRSYAERFGRSADTPLGLRLDGFTIEDGSVTSPGQVVRGTRRP